MTFPLGGEHGDEVRKFLDLQIGVAGTITVLSVLAFCYVIYFSSKAIIFVRTVLNPTDYIKSKFPVRTVETSEAETPEEGAAPADAQIEEVPTDEGPLTVDLTTGEIIVDAETGALEGTEEEGTAHDEGTAPQNHSEKSGL